MGNRTHVPPCAAAGTGWARAATGRGTEAMGKDRDIPGEVPADVAVGRLRPLWVEEPARRRRLADPVRTAAVRAVVIIAVTLVQAMIAALCTLAGAWLAFPAVLLTVAGTIASTWGVLDVWVTRQVWNQRHGVESRPSSTARARRRERRRQRAAERAAARAARRRATARAEWPEAAAVTDRAGERRHVSNPRQETDRSLTTTS
ncbi:hypothetical protein LRS74_04125 [Streptomyces sp. LX-29]|nr:hypothetical protein LRS74_04125 [Streptomyces sp. LX-29]